MLTLADFTSPALIVADLKLQEMTAVVQRLSSLLFQERRVSDPEAFSRFVLRREELSSTAISPGWALPHARVPGVNRLAYALGRTLTPLPWGHARISVHWVFLLVVPENDITDCLALNAGLARLVQDTAAADRLWRARDELNIFEELGRTPLRRSASPKRAA